MEASVLSSNPYKKTTEIPPIKPLYTRRNTRNRKRYAAPSSVACCRSSLPPMEDEGGSNLRSDWRAFRARLAAKERAIRSEFVTEPQFHEPIGENWAHAIHEPEKGCLLIATEKLDGVHIFERTVILLLSAGPIYRTGVILNRPSLMSIKETRSSAMDTSGLFSDRPLFFGGPVEEGIFLVSPKSEDGNDGGGRVFDEVMRGVYYGATESVGGAADLVKMDLFQAEDFRFFDGCCAWDKLQLRDEIWAGYWGLAACSPNLIWAPSFEIIGLWDQINALIGPRKVW